MTEEDKDILIGKMIDKPETLTDDDIAMILSDSELKELYEISAGLASELIPMPEIDVDAEWSRMQSEIAALKPRKSFNMRWLGAAAVIAAILTCGTIATKFILSDSNSCQPVKTPYISKVATSDNESKSLNDNDNTPEFSIGVTKIIEVEAKSETNKADSEEFIRIEEARIDNEVAMALARVYQEDYAMDLEGLAEMLSAMPEVADSIVNQFNNRININQLTML